MYSQFADAAANILLAYANGKEVPRFVATRFCRPITDVLAQAETPRPGSGFWHDWRGSIVADPEIIWHDPLALETSP
jgi:hypothetical protein